jgi:hypothetical protein
MTTDHWIHGWGSSSGKVKRISLPHNIQTAETRPTSYPMGTIDSFLGDKAIGDLHGVLAYAFTFV